MLRPKLRGAVAAATVAAAAALLPLEGASADTGPMPPTPLAPAPSAPGGGAPTFVDPFPGSLESLIAAQGQALAREAALFPGLTTEWWELVADELWCQTIVGPGAAFNLRIDCTPHIVSSY